MRQRIQVILLMLALAALFACKTTPPPPIANVGPNLAIEPEPVTQTATTVPATRVTLPATHTPAPTNTPILPNPSPTPFYSGPLSPECGQILPLLPTNTAAKTTELTINREAEAALLEILPETAVPAWQQIVDSPDTVGLAVYRVGDEANGVFLNAERQMPLASVSKLIHLAAYAEAVGQGQLNAVTPVTVEALDAYYLPNLDLGGHNRSLAELADNEKLTGEPPAVLLEDMAWMMIRHSSNAATDYLHLLLGQTTIEATAVTLGLSSQTAPCPWVGQFLAMSNHTRAGSDRAALAAYLEDPASYGREVNLLTDAYVNDENFRETARDRIFSSRRPSMDTQRYFGQNLNTHGSPKDYAKLMALFAQNGLSNPDSSFIARITLEWPMLFPDNQALFSNLGYKNGSLPGILTTVYYAYPLGETTPIVLALFYRDLPNRTYQQWRRSLPHDEFARWLLYEPAALPTLKATLNQ